MKIGRWIKEVEFPERIIPVVIPKQDPKPVEEPIRVPNWPQKDPAVVPAQPEKANP